MRRRSRSVTESATYGTYMGNDRMLIRLPLGKHLIAVASDLSLTPELVTQGMYDWPFWKFIHRTLRNGDRAVDVGANIGLFTLAMAVAVGPDGHVTAYEPDALMAQLVRDNLTSNWVADRATVVEAAVGKAPGEITFARHPTFLGSSSAGATDLAGHSVSGGYESVAVPVERLDQRISGRVRLVKVDVEGGEADVLAGFPADGADFLDVEVLRDTAHDWEALVEQLRRLPGSPHEIEQDGRLRAVPLATVIDRGRWPHVVFA